MSELNYAYGKSCTWNGPVLSTVPMRSVEHGLSVMTPHCPICHGELWLFNEEKHLADVRAQELLTPGAAALSNWSKGKCFPNHDILENAYRQAMEE